MSTTMNCNNCAIFAPYQGPRKLNGVDSVERVVTLRECLTRWTVDETTQRHPSCTECELVLDARSTKQSACRKFYTSRNHQHRDNSDAVVSLLLYTYVDNCEMCICRHVIT